MKKLFITSLAIAALTSSGAAYALGTLSFSTPLDPNRTYNREMAPLAAPNYDYTLPSFDATFKSIAQRTYDFDFNAHLTLDQGALWHGDGPGALTSSMFTATALGSCIYTATLQSPLLGTAAEAVVLFNVGPVNCVATSPVTVVFNPGGAYFKDPSHVMVNGGTINLTIWMIDSNLPLTPPIDGPVTGPFVHSRFGVSLGTVEATTATIDLFSSPPLDFFVATNGDTTTIDRRGAIETINSTDLLLWNGGTGGYTADPADCMVVTVAGPMTSVNKIYYGDWNTGTAFAYTVTAADVLASSATFRVPADQAHIGGEAQVQIEVKGTGYPLSARSFNVSEELDIHCVTPLFQNTFLSTPTLLTTWSYNGTRLWAPWVNANTDIYWSRLYVSIFGDNGEQTESGSAIVLFRIVESSVSNPGPVSAGPVPVTVCDYTPLTPAENIFKNATRMLKLERLFQACGVPMPYLGVNGGGNVGVELLIGASSAEGVANIFNMQVVGGNALGTYRMFKIGSMN
jgi:hypothetical protein